MKTPAQLRDLFDDMVSSLLDAKLPEGELLVFIRTAFDTLGVYPESAFTFRAVPEVRAAFAERTVHLTAISGIPCPWCDTCGQPGIWTEGRGWAHCDPASFYPNGVPRLLLDLPEHEITCTEWNAL